ncbi:uncharacterized protein DUF3987 [Ochrobactrum sp. BH3]|nr:uncharacterized protein DUF3987 [Ochrobactrum sp. BH3]
MNIQRNHSENLGDFLAASALSPLWPDKHDVSVTLYRSLTSHTSMSKSYSVNEDGRIVKVGKSGFVAERGQATRLTYCGTPIQILEQFKAQLELIDPQEALVLAPPNTDTEETLVVPEKQLSENPAAIAKNGTFFTAPAGPAIMGLDFDKAAWPEFICARVDEDAVQLSGVLASAFSGFNISCFLSRPSTSAFIQNTETGEDTGRPGEHRYYLVENGAAVKEFAALLHQRLILAGFGYGKIDKTGNIHICSLIDVAATSDYSRFWYEADPKLLDPRLTRNRNREVLFHRRAGSLLRPDEMPSLTAAELEKLQDIGNVIRAELAEEASRQREVYTRQRSEILRAKGIDASRTDEIISLAIDKHVLPAEFEIELNDGTITTVAEILQDRERYNGVTCPDPLEPDYGIGKAMIMLSSCRPHIKSFAHGGREFQLQHDGALKWFDPEAASRQDVSLFPDEPTESWPEPIDLFGNELPTRLSEPPAGSLPPILERWARSEARRKGVPLSFAAASALATVAAAIGSSLNIQARSKDNTWALPASLWICLVAPPGSAKSPMISSAIAPLRKLDTEWRKIDCARHADWSERKRNKATANICGPEPRMRRTLVDDTTIEQLIRIQADNPRGVLRVPDELSALLGSFGAYKKTGDGDRGNFLGMFDGRAISKDRVNGNSSVYAEHALLGILAGTQPKKIATCVRDLGGDGLLQRFLFVVHDGVEREGLDEAPDIEAGHRYAHIVRQLATAEYGSKTPVRLSPAAYVVLQDGWRKIKTLMHIPGASDDWVGHVNKWENFLHRIALAFHAVEMVEFLGLVDPTWEVAEDVARRAVAFSSYLVRHGLQFYETNYQGADDTVLARWIAGHFLTKPALAAVTVRDITDIKKELRGEQNYRTLAAVMAELERFGWVQVSKTTSRGPSQWKINPAVHERFKQRADWERKTREEKRERIQQAVKARNDFTSTDILSGLEA